jgi:hypothetical protein
MEIFLIALVSFIECTVRRLGLRTSPLQSYSFPFFSFFLLSEDIKFLYSFNKTGVFLFPRRFEILAST